jgi:transposase InsO family protein
LHPNINVTGISGSVVPIDLQEVVSLQFSDDQGLEQELELGNTNFAKALRHNLISVVKLDDAGCHVLFGEGKAQVFPPGSVTYSTNEKGEKVYIFPREKTNILVARRSGGLYRVNGVIRKPREKIHQALMIDETWGKRKTSNQRKQDRKSRIDSDTEKAIDKLGLRDEVNREREKASRKIAKVGTSKSKALTLKEWHETLGHIAYTAVLKLADTGKIQIKGERTIQFCHDCALNKSTRATPPKTGRKRASRILEIVHSDVCGPFPVRAIGGYRYFVTFIDDFTSHTTTYLLKKKSEVFEKLKEFILVMEVTHGTRTAIIRTDSGGEYTSLEVDRYCKERGITHQRTVPHTPHQNGVAERMNRTLLELARTMLSSGKMALHFWGYAVLHATNIRNHSPSSAINGMIPIGALTGANPDYSSFRAFGSPAYGNIVTEKRSKLGKAAVYGRYLGSYDGVSKAYLIFDAIKRKVIKTTSCIFIERFDFLRAPRSPPLESLSESMDENDLSEYDKYHDGDTMLAQEEAELIMQDEARDEIDATSNTIIKTRLAKEEEVRKDSAQLRRSARIAEINSETKERHERANPASTINSLLSEHEETTTEWSLLIEKEDSRSEPLTIKKQ